MQINHCQICGKPLCGNKIFCASDCSDTKKSNVKIEYTNHNKLAWIGREVIENALHSLYRKPNTKKCKYKAKKNPLRYAALQIARVKKERQDALDWFNERSQEVWGYGWCLSVSRLPPSFVRAKINEAIKFWETEKKHLTN